MANVKVLVLGGTGPAGICLLRELIHRKYKVVAFARSPSKIPEDLSSNPLIEVVQGELSDTRALDEAVAKSNVVVSLLGPQLSNRSMAANTIPDFYKQSLFPAMRKHHVKRIFAMGTLSIIRPEDKRSMLRAFLVLLVRVIANAAYNTIIGLGEVFENDAKDLDWTIFRIGNIPGESDAANWAQDREDGPAFVGWVAEPGWTLSQRRGALVRWLVDAVEGGLTDWVQKMPAVSKLGAS